MKQPLVSIIVLSALRQNSTQECLKSIDRFTAISHEIIVVDMGYSHSIRQWLNQERAQRKNFKLILNSQNVGTSRGRNQAIGLAKGKYIVFLDNDTLVKPFWLEYLLQTAKRWPNGAMFGPKLVYTNNYVYFCDKYIFDQKMDNVRRIGLKILNPLRQNDSAANTETAVPWCPTGCLMIKREVLDILKGFDENLVFVEEDKDLSLRVRRLGKEIIYCPLSTVIHDRPQDNIYDSRVRFNNLRQIDADIKYFESKWACKVDLIYSKQALQYLGYSDRLIDDMLADSLGKFFSLV